jgi:hypothetical protein
MRWIGHEIPAAPGRCDGALVDGLKGVDPNSKEIDSILERLDELCED